MALRRRPGILVRASVSVIRCTIQWHRIDDIPLIEILWSRSNTSVTRGRVHTRTIRGHLEETNEYGALAALFFPGRNCQARSPGNFHRYGREIRFRRSFVDRGTRFRACTCGRVRRNRKFFYGHIPDLSPPRQRLHDTHCTQQRRPYTPMAVALK